MWIRAFSIRMPCRRRNLHKHTRSSILKECYGSIIHSMPRESRIKGRCNRESPYDPALRAFGFTGYHKGLELVRNYG